MMNLEEKKEFLKKVEGKNRMLIDNIAKMRRDMEAISLRREDAIRISNAIHGFNGNLESIQKLLDTSPPDAALLLALINLERMRESSELELRYKDYWKDIESAKKLKRNLTVGRALGAEANKNKTEKSHELILQINADLLKNPDTARWQLDKRAEYIEKQDVKMVNGKKYSVRTIKNIITGT